jgi:Fic family protein
VIPADFTPSAPGSIIADSRGFYSFVPNPLPPAINLSWELVNLLSEADRGLSELAGIVRTLPNAQLLIGPFVRREAVLSSRIEGTYAGVADVVLYEASKRAEKGDAREVANYVRAVEKGIEMMAELPISLRLIRAIHAVLLEETGGEHLTPGEFRRSQNWIGVAGCTLQEATFVPPPPDRLMDCLGQLETFFHAEAELPPLIRLALIHYQFEAIHPFLDGNGRVGRLLIILLLMDWGILPQPLLYLSAFFESNRPAYYKNLLAVSQEGKWEEWIRFFLSGVREQSKDARLRATALLSLWQNYRERLQTVRSSGLLLRLVDRLLAHPAVTVTQVGNELSVTSRTAQQLVNRLVTEQILTEVSGQRWGRLYIAHDVVQIIEDVFPT